MKLTRRTRDRLDVLYRRVFQSKSLATLLQEVLQQEQYLATTRTKRRIYLAQISPDAGTLLVARRNVAIISSGRVSRPFCQHVDGLGSLIMAGTNQEVQVADPKYA